MNAGPSGFQNAPVTRTFIIASALLTLIFGVRGRSLRLGLSYQNTIVNLHVWRLIASVFAFSSTPEFIFAVCLLYYFRIFERQIGSNKYSIFILFSLIFSTLFEVLALALLKESTSTTLASGPYGLIFSSFIPFYFDIPVSSRLRMYGIHFSDKSFVYLAGLQLLLSSWKRSLVPGIAGLIAGFLYHLNAFGIRRIKFPGIVTSLFSRLSWSSRNSSQTSSSRRNVSAHAPSHAGRQVERTRAAASVPAAEPPESSITTLVSMGFDGNSARQALIRAGNDINVATNILLEAHPPH